MENIRQILKHYWGYDNFRPVQEQVIRAVLEGVDTLVLLPTGGGKSICYQVPALASEGVCIVVSPLVALMKDQVDQLKRRGIPAAAIHSGMSRREIDIVLDNCIYGTTKFLYVSPERLRTTLMIERAKQMKVNLLAVDEAHCISEWGYDFRPPYLQIPEFHALLHSVPVIAVTATATPAVQVDIIDKLQLRSPQRFSQTFARQNLSYSVFNQENKERKLLQILQRTRGSGIVYVRTRKRTEQIAAWLHSQGIASAFYHAGLTFADRNKRQNAWIHNQIRIIVATNAFGMGIDKPDVRCVVHLDIPDNLDAYYQEAGRAGRDGAKAYAVALYQDKDLADMEKQIQLQFPALDHVRLVYQSLANYCRLPVGSGEMTGYSFDLSVFCKSFGLQTTDVFYAIKLLENEGFIQLSEDFNIPSKIHIQVDTAQLYEFRVRYSELDKFLQVVLRLYGGELFTDYVRISEKEIAAAFFCSEQEVVKYLSFMQEREILVYEARLDKPQLTWLTPRFDAVRLPLDSVKIEGRKKKDLDRLKMVINYAQHIRRCRTQLFQDYFGETDSEPCGVCDVCIENRKRENPQAKVIADAPEAIILDYLGQNGPVLPRDLVGVFRDFSEKETIQKLQQMLEEELLEYDTTGRLVVKRK